MVHTANFAQKPSTFVEATELAGSLNWFICCAESSVGEVNGMNIPRTHKQESLMQEWNKCIECGESLIKVKACFIH